MGLKKIATALDKGLKVTEGIRASYQYKDGRTKLNQTRYKELAKNIRTSLKLEKGENWVPKVKQSLGEPYWDKNGNAVKNPSAGKPFHMRSGSGSTILLKDAAERQADKKAQYETRKLRKDPAPKSVKEWADRLTKANKWPKGKSLKDFLSKEKALDTRMKTLMSVMKTKGLKVDDGHAMSLGNVAKKGHPLYAKGMHGSDSGSARVPELRSVNQGKQHKGDMHFLDAKRGGVANSALDRFAQYLTGNRGTLAQPTKGDVAKMMRGENPDKVIAARDKTNQRFKALNSIKKSKSNTKSYQGVVDVIKSEMPDTTMNVEDLYDQKSFVSPFGAPMKGI